MNHSAGIQFYGIDNVVQAYANNQCAPFALWSGKLQLLKYDGNGPDGYKKPTIEEGQQLLNEYLNAMYQGTTAIYTLRTYEDLKEGEKIKPSTEYDTAFNFKINVAQQQEGLIPYTGTRGNNMIVEELRSLKAEIAAIKSGEDDDDTEEPSIIGMVNDLVQEPAKLREVAESIAIIGDVVKGFLGMPIQNRVASIGHVNRVSDISSDTETQEQKLNRLQNALDELERHDPQIVDHLEQLATIAKRDPKKFKGLIGMLTML